MLYWFSGNGHHMQKWLSNQFKFGHLQWSSEEDLLIAKINAHYEEAGIKK